MLATRQAVIGPELAALKSALDTALKDAGLALPEGGSNLGAKSKGLVTSIDIHPDCNPRRYVVTLNGMFPTEMWEVFAEVLARFDGQRDLIHFVRGQARGRLDGFVFREKNFSSNSWEQLATYPALPT